MLLESGAGLGNWMRTNLAIDDPVPIFLVGNLFMNRHPSHASDGEILVDSHWKPNDSAIRNRSIDGRRQIATPSDI